MGAPALWATRAMNEVYRELEHPADLWLEIRGDDPESLSEHALYALYASMVHLERVRPLEERTLQAQAGHLAGALRRLLAEALYLFDAEGYVAGAATVGLSAGEPGGPGAVALEARVWGEVFDPCRHERLSEIKAVTYHQLSAGPATEGGWRATVLLDV
ncbi:MAG: archease [Thermoleophilia bacterium]|nr:archease [Thermoleophilia bacterium]